MIAHRRYPAIDGAGTDRDENFAVGAKLAQHMHIVGIAHPTLNQTDIAWIAMFDVGKRRAIEFNAFQQGHQSFIHIEEGQMATEAAGKGCSGDSYF